jgi:hypothetical protein
VIAIMTVFNIYPFLDLSAYLFIAVHLQSMALLYQTQDGHQQCRGKGEHAVGVRGFAKASCQASLAISLEYNSSSVHAFQQNFA